MVYYFYFRLDNETIEITIKLQVAQIFKMNIMISSRLHRDEHVRYIDYIVGTMLIICQTTTFLHIYIYDTYCYLLMYISYLLYFFM